MNKKTVSMPALGAASLICIFTVLCLVVFALLSISTVQGRYNLSRAAADTVADHYEAEAKAHELVAAIRAGEEPEGVAFDDSDSAGFSLPVSETARLDVSVKVPSGETVHWQEVPLPRTEEAEFPELWDGGQPNNSGG